MQRRSIGAILSLAGVMLIAACSSQSDSPASGATPTNDAAPTTDATSTITFGFATGTPDAVSSPTANARRFTPPLEGPPRGPGPTGRTNYRELTEFQLPAPGDLPQPPISAKGQEFYPPVTPECPDGWENLERPAEGFIVCYPPSWSIDGHGYVSSGVDDRWYSVGFFLFDADVDVTHVSIYVTNPFAEPVTYTRDCDEPYRVAFAGEPAVLCADFPGQQGEVRIISYHIRRGDLDYFVNVVPRFDYDVESHAYLDTWDRDAEAIAIQVAQTFQLVDIAHS